MEKATLDAAQYADENSLWNNSGKAKVPVVNGPFGYLGDGTPTSTVNVYRREAKDAPDRIHATPGSEK